MKRMLPLLLAACLLLCACAGAPAEPTEPAESTDPTVPATAPSDTPTVPATAPSTAPTVADGPVYRNPFTGEIVDAPVTARPFACTMNNVPDALPHYGSSQADIVYECLVEGNLTRCLAIFSDVSELEKYGSVRSARECFVDIAYAYGAMFAHAGGNTYSEQEFYRTGCYDLNALGGVGADYFYRDQARLDAGYAYEHTLFTSGEELTGFARALGYPLETDAPIDFGFQFADDAAPAGDAAEELVISFEPNGKTTTMRYDAQTGRYEASQYGSVTVDANTGEPDRYKNVFVIQAETWRNGDGLTFMTLTGEGDGYFACGGRIVPIRWSRAEKADCFRYTLTDGTPLTLGVGNSYVAVTTLSGGVSY